MKKKIIFVYNADSDFFSSVKDLAHKIIAPKNYSCNLCKITFGNFKIKEKWRDFILHLGIEVEFLHKDEFLKKYKSEESFPAAFIEKERLEILIKQEEINKLKNLSELIMLVNKKLKKL